MNIGTRGLLLCVALVGLAGGTMAQAPESNPQTGRHSWHGDDGPRDDGDESEHGGWHHHHHHHHWHRHRWGHGGPGLLGSLRELDLSKAQREQIHTLMEGARGQWQEPERATPPTNPMAVLRNPGDPGYAAAVQAAKQRAGERIQAMSDLQLKIYNLLTPQQKTVFAKLSADKQARWDKWREGRDGHWRGGDKG
jgi:Spy/CpxP family protein refolding chaperone